jgi:hypothetical protein
MNVAENETYQQEADAADSVVNETSDAGENQAASTDAEAPESGDDDGELIVSIGEEAPPQPEETAAPAWVRDLRKHNRELTKRLKELEAKERQQPAQTALPPKPTLESCDYDADEFERQLDGWKDAKRNADDAEASARKQQEQAEQAWQSRLSIYTERKQALPADDVDDAEQNVRELFGDMRWAILVDGADDPAMLVYALGKYPERAKELAKIESLAQFTFKAAKLESELKVTKRKSTVAPEKPMTGTAPVGVAGADAALERLRADAEKTGDYSKVIAYRKQKRAA